MEDLTGRKLGKYQLEGLVGRGGMASVYRAYHPNLQRDVAVKVLHHHLSLKTLHLERFKREAAAVAQLRHHNIVQVYDFDFEGFTPYMVMEYIDGKSLQDRLDAEKSFQVGLSINETTAIFLPLAGAVKYAHAQGIVHRDIKPSNIMFTPDGQVVLADFGIAYVIGNPESTPAGEFVGTPEFMSPEQFQDSPVDGRSDIYALGILLFLLLTGHSPFFGENMMEIILKHVQHPAPLPSSFNPTLSEQLDRVIGRTLEKEPGARYSTVDEFVRDFLEAAKVEYRIPQDAWQAIDDRSDVIKPYPGTAILVAAEQVAPIQRVFQAPRDVPDFVGRQTDLDRLDRMLVQESDQNLICVTGMGGIGKTALAIRAAHTLQDDFPDGVLWASIAASDTLSILNSWTQAIQADFSRLPDLQARAAALRSAFHDKRALFILDDVRTAEEIQLLLPSGSHCVALITTKNLDLSVALKAHELHLSQMSDDECFQLMSRIAGEQRVSQETETAGAIFQLLGNLPLAVDIAARRLASRHRWRLRDLYERLSDEKSRLDVLEVSDIAVRTSFAISWDDLDRDLQRTFSLISVFEERPFRVSALAAVADLDRSTARDHLDTLVSFSLLFEQGEQHYRQHTLLYSFARQQFGDDPVAWGKLVDFYLSYASEYQDQFLALEPEMDNIFAGMKAAHRLSAWRRVIAYAGILRVFWFARGHFSAARQGYLWACQAAEALDEQDKLADFLCYWAEACIEQGDYETAENLLYRSRKFQKNMGNQQGLGRALYNLGLIAVDRAQYELAENLLGESLQIQMTINNDIGVADVLYRQAYLRFYQQDFNQTEKILTQALALQEGQSNWRGVIRTLSFLALLELQLDNPAAAMAYGQRAIQLCDEHQEQAVRVTILETISDIQRYMGDFENARQTALDSLDLLKKHGDRKAQAHLNYKLSLVETELGNYKQALNACQESLQLTEELGDTWGCVFVLWQMGNSYQYLEQTQLAREAWERGLKISNSFPDHPKQEELRRLLKI